MGDTVDPALEREDHRRHRIEHVEVEEDRVTRRDIADLRDRIHDRRHPEPREQDELEQVLDVAEVHVQHGDDQREPDQQQQLDEETRQQFLSQIREQTARLTKLATNLLDLSKLEAGSLELNPEPTDVAELARTVTAEFTPALTRHDSHLELRLRRGQITALCDRERLAQILRILIDNALAHTATGTRIFVSTARENGTVRVAVRDDGRGIGTDVLPRIFEPFYTSNDAQGSGLGLAIARELAEQMDGHLFVDSAPGRTTFTLELPAYRVGAGRPAGDGAALPHPHTSSPA